MANRAAKERNTALRGRTGALTRAQRKRRGMKSKPYGKGKMPPGTAPERPAHDWTIPELVLVF